MIQAVMQIFLYTILLIAVVAEATSYKKCFKDKQPNVNSRSCPAVQKEQWSYSGGNGPEFWGSIGYPDCSGKRQSPINIETRKAKMQKSLNKLQFVNYNKPVTKAEIENLGKTVELLPEDNVERSIYVDRDYYYLKNLHFHFSGAGTCGSEHEINGMPYTMEGHFVHKNQNGDIAVVGVFFKEGKTNWNLQPFVDALPDVLYKEEKADLSSSFKLSTIIPSQSYYRYDGSLTTPPCSENVKWHVMKGTISVGSDQMKRFRKLSSATENEGGRQCTMYDNYRPLQPLNGRKVLSSK